MKLRALSLLGFLLAARASGAGDAAIEFRGVLVTDGKPKIAVADSASGRTEWLEPGAEFNGYAIVRYDEKAGTVIAKKDGREHSLSLVAIKPATTGASASVPTNSVPPSQVPVPVTIPATAPAEPPLSPTGNMPPTPTNQPVAAPAPAVPPAPTTVNISVAPVAPAAALTDSGYVTKEGDTLSTISASTGLSLQRLQELNPGVNAAAVLRPGDPIRTR